MRLLKIIIEIIFQTLRYSCADTAKALTWAKSTLSHVKKRENNSYIGPFVSFDVPPTMGP